MPTVQKLYKNCTRALEPSKFAWNAANWWSCRDRTHPPRIPKDFAVFIFVSVVRSGAAPIGSGIDHVALRPMSKERVKRARTTPSFKGLSASSPLSSHIKSRNKSTDTRHELALRRELWRRGLRYRTDVRTLPGRPDIVFKGARVAVFCDGDFWHGRNWQTLQQRLEKRANPAYWIAKIGSNIERDRRIDHQLTELGWRVVRLWETDIQADPAMCADEVQNAIEERQRSFG